MIENKQLLIIGGAKRNDGKTTLIEKIIKKFSPEYNIVSLKVKTIYFNDDYFHGKDRIPLTKKENFRITEERNNIGNEDTNRMLNAGAKRVFKIKTKSNYIQEAFLNLILQIEGNTLIICESNSLRKYVIPASYIFIKEEGINEMKPTAKKMIKHADRIINTDGKSHDFDINNLKIINACWFLES